MKNGTARRLMSIGLTAAWVLCAFTLGLYFFQFGGGLSPDADQWDHFGSYVGGTLGPIFAILAFVAALYAIRKQGQQSNLDEIQRLLASTSDRINLLLAQTPEDIPKLAADQLRPDGGLDSMGSMLSKLFRRAIWAADDDTEAISGLVATLSIAATRSQLAEIEKQMVHLVRLFTAHETLDGAEVIREHYQNIYIDLIGAMWMFQSLHSDATIQYFEPEKIVAESRRVAQQVRREQEAMFARQDAK